MWWLLKLSFGFRDQINKIPNHSILINEKAGFRRNYKNCYLKSGSHLMWSMIIFKVAGFVDESLRINTNQAFLDFWPHESNPWSKIFWKQAYESNPRCG